MRACLITFLLLSASAFPLEAGTQILNESYPEVPKTEVTVESIFGAGAQQGGLPFRIKIWNGSGQDRVWKVQIRDGYYGRNLSTNWSAEFAVENGRETVQEMVLPFSPEFIAYTYRNVEVMVTSPGLKTFTRTESYQVNDSFPTLAVSQRLATRSLAKLDDLISKRGSGDQRFGDSFEPELLPSDWRAYSGLDGLLIDFQTWQSINAAQKRALLEWVRLGGELHVYVSSKDYPEFQSTDLGIDGLTVPREMVPTSAPLSLGQVRIEPWNGVELADTILRIYDRLTLRSDQLGNEFEHSWNLAEALGKKPFNRVLIFGILLAFAIIVAPVNLFWLAGQGKRHRLFITTPIISVAACLIIVLMIFIGDGSGGKGARVTFADLQPAASERRLFLTQEQVSRTGVIVDPGFASNQNLLLEPVKLEQSPFNALSGGSGRSTEFNFSPGRFSGGFFRSRSQQGFVARASEPTRARIELRNPGGNGGNPALVSSLPTAVQSFYYRDGAGKTWKSQEAVETVPGGTFVIEPVETKDLTRFIDQQTADFSPALQARIRSLSREKNRFFAITSDPEAYTIPTHPGIVWDNQLVLLSGTVDATNSDSPRPE